MLTLVIDAIDDIIDNVTADDDVGEDETDIPAQDIIDIDDIVDNDNDVGEYETDISAQGQYCLTIDQHCQC